MLELESTTISPLADTTIESVVNYHEDVWVEVDIRIDYVIVDELKILCGEGAMGNEGFVAAINDRGLVWALFSTRSNPFVKLELEGGKLLAYADSLKYEIDLNNPSKIKVDNYCIWESE